MSIRKVKMATTADSVQPVLTWELEFAVNASHLNYFMQVYVSEMWCRGPYPNTPPAQAIHLQHQFHKQPASSTRHHSISPILSWMDIDPKRICQGDGSEQCLPKKVEGHLLI